MHRSCTLVCEDFNYELKSLFAPASMLMDLQTASYVTVASDCRCDGYTHYTTVGHLSVFPSARHTIAGVHNGYPACLLSFDQAAL